MCIAGTYTIIVQYPATAPRVPGWRVQRYSWQGFWPPAGPGASGTAAVREPPTAGGEGEEGCWHQSLAISCSSAKDSLVVSSLRYRSHANFALWFCHVSASRQSFCVSAGLPCKHPRRALNTLCLKAQRETHYAQPKRTKAVSPFAPLLLSHSFCSPRVARRPLPARLPRKAPRRCSPACVRACVLLCVRAIVRAIAHHNVDAAEPGAEGVLLAERLRLHG